MIANKFNLKDEEKLGKLNIKIGNNVIFGENVILEKNIKIGNNVKIDDFSRILSNVEIGDNSYIGSYSTIGEIGVDYFSTDIIKKKTLIDKNALIRSYSCIYCGTLIGENFETGHRVTIREKTTIGKNTRIGTLSDIQGYCEIGNYVRLHSNVHVGQKSQIEDFVWIFPYCILTNDPTPPSENLCGVNIKRFAVIATGSIVLPGVVVGEESFVGAKTLVNKNLDKGNMAVGNPMKIIGTTKKIKNKLTGESVYPWKLNFDRGMPWEKIGYLNWKNNIKEKSKGKL